jgi:hypothetical protein
MGSNPDLFLPLESKPTIEQIGSNTHPLKKKEIFVMRGRWSIHLYHYHGDLEFGGTKIAFSPGTITIAPPDTLLAWHFNEAPAFHYYAHFSFPKVDAQRECIPLKALHEVQDSFQYYCNEFSEIIDSFSTQRTKADIYLWHFLWQLHAGKKKAIERGRTQLPTTYRPHSILLITNSIGLAA